MSSRDTHWEMRRMVTRENYSPLFSSSFNYDLAIADLQDLADDTYESEKTRKEAAEYLALVQEAQAAIIDAVRKRVHDYLADSANLEHVKDILEEAGEIGRRRWIYEVNDNELTSLRDEISTTTTSWPRDEIFWDMVKGWAEPIARVSLPWDGNPHSLNSVAAAVVLYSLPAGGKFFLGDMNHGDMGYLSVSFKGRVYDVLWNSARYPNFIMKTPFGAANVSMEAIQFRTSPFTTFYGIAHNSDARNGLVVEIREALRQHEKERQKEYAEIELSRLPVTDNVYSKLPSDASPSAIHALRWLEKNNTDSIPAKTFKKLPFGRKAWGVALLQAVNGRDVTRQDIFAHARLPLGEGPVYDLLSMAHARYVPYRYKDLQLIWPLPNYVYLVSAPVEEVAEYVGESTETLAKRIREMYESHPYYPEEVTLGWIRFTEIGPGSIWIDEIQTDAADMDHLGLYYDGEVDWDDLLREILRAFVLDMRKRNVQSIYIPNYEVADEKYDRMGAPKFPYSDLPRELGFEQIDDVPPEDFTYAKKAMSNKYGESPEVMFMDVKGNIANRAFRINPAKRGRR